MNQPADQTVNKLAPPPITVRHDPAGSRFVAELHGALALANYQLQDGVMHITHTEVPPSLQGLGIAAQVVVFALAHARAEGLRVRPVCSYVATYMQRHPETQDLLES
jgi:uncharacterized protein